MKWDEIPKFKEFGMTNPIDMGFVYCVKFIKNEIAEYNLQMNPDFQRGHVWTEEQQIAYVQFILRGGKSGRDFYFNWNHENNEYVCVDGLQRTTAFERFVNGEIKVFSQYFSDFGFGREANGNPLPEYKVRVHQNNLTSRKEILEWYVDMNVGGTPHTNDEIERVKKMIEELG